MAAITRSLRGAPRTAPTAAPRGYAAAAPLGSPSCPPRSPSARRATGARAGRSRGGGSAGAPGQARHLGLVEFGAGLALRTRAVQPSRQDPRPTGSAARCSKLAARRPPACQKLSMSLVEARPGLERHRPRHEVVDADDLLLVARADGGAAGVAVHAVE
eukprot:scaffold84212_cov63-Phaeocystis_antarctica.AAC.5